MFQKIESSDKSRHGTQNVELAALLNKISKSQSQPGYILTFSDLASVIEWNESNMKPAGIRPMPLIATNLLLHPTAKPTQKLEHLVIAKMTGSWDKNHCLRWKSELLRFVFINDFASRNATLGRHHRNNEIDVSENKDILLVNKWRDAACSIQRNKQKCVEIANEKLLSKCAKYFVAKETTSTATTKTTTTTTIPQDSLRILIIDHHSIKYG